MNLPETVFFTVDLAPGNRASLSVVPWYNLEDIQKNTHWVVNKTKDVHLFALELIKMSVSKC